jgi:hypothetical protein
MFCQDNRSGKALSKEDFSKVDLFIEVNYMSPAISKQKLELLAWDT